MNGMNRLQEMDITDIVDLGSFQDDFEKKISKTCFHSKEQETIEQKAD